MRIREIVESDRPDWVRLRDALWPGSLSEHDAETRQHFETLRQAPIVFVAEADQRIVGFLELDYRKYVPGCRVLTGAVHRGLVCRACPAGPRHRASAR